jgi:hypothetical protein
VRASLDLPPALKPSRRPRRAVVDALVYAPVSGRLEALPFAPARGRDVHAELDVEVEVGAEVRGPEETFSTLLAEVSVIGNDLRHARAAAAEVLRDPPVVSPPHVGTKLITPSAVTLDVISNVPAWGAGRRAGCLGPWGW